MACKCQECEELYTVDLIIDNELWEKIKPLGKPSGAGLLCGKCIMEKIEIVSTYEGYKLIKIEG